MVTGIASWNKIPEHLPPSRPHLAGTGGENRLLQALEGLVGIACIADDILIYGAGDTLDEKTKDHHKNLTSL